MGIDQIASRPHTARKLFLPHPLSQIEEVLKWQETELRPGDILLLRTGVVRWFEQASAADKVKGMIENDNWPGLEATEESKRWLWNRHFAAVASDNMSFEFGPHGGKYLVSLPLVLSLPRKVAKQTMHQSDTDIYCS